MSFGFGFALPAYPLRGGTGNNPFNQLGPTLDLSFTGVVTDLTDPNGYTLNTDFIIPQYQIAAQYVVWETGVGLVDKTFSQIITFTRASTGTYFDSAGVLQSAASGTPRFDYNPVTLAPLGFLIEEARTNSLLQSEAFNTTWTTSNASVTANSTTAPTGTTVADTLVEDTANNFHYVQQTVSGTTNTNNYTLSCFIKASTRTAARIAIIEGTTFSRQVRATVDLSAGTVVGAALNSATLTAATITPVGNSWYRVTVAGVLGGTDTNILCAVYVGQDTATFSYTGNGTGSIFVFGAQLEAGAFPTSYIPTTTTALTRSADVASVNTLSPWFNATEGTLFAEFNIPSALTSGSGPRLFTLQGTGGAAVDEMPLFVVQASGKAVSFNAFTGGVNAGRMDASPAFVANTIIKAAATYATNARAVTAGGAVPTTSATVFTIPTITVARLGAQDAVGNSVLNGYLRRIVYYPRRLTNDELRTISLPTGATITTQDYSLDTNFVGNTVAIGS